MTVHLFVRALLCLSIFPSSFSTLYGWQQRVHYRMWIDLDVSTHSYDGRQQLLYTNNSPDTLHEVYYHLFYNAFKPESRMDRRDKSFQGGWKEIDALQEEEQGDVSLMTLEQDGQRLEWSMDETLLHVRLARPLLPNDSTRLEMTWRTVIPRLKRRGGWGSHEGVEFSMSQWYPKLAEYDKHGWHPDEYVEREFYGVFGTFDVEITLPAGYVVGGTGVVRNPEEVRCGYEFKGRDTLLMEPACGDGLKTWKFHAENVHDFAWVADREYIHLITHMDEIPIHILVKRSFYKRVRSWRHAAKWTREILQYFNKRFGRYAWPQFTVAHAGDGGMEYPMLIMITGYRRFSSLYRVIAHELGHQWYYGMMANNETQQAWLDEGLTQYLTDEADRNLNGQPARNDSWLRSIVYPWDRLRWRDIYLYYQQAIVGYDEALDTYHDRFREATTASLVYSKGEAVVRQLQYMLGDSLFDAGMRQYYDEWRFRHPDQRDFERSMEKASGMRLDWFFNQWINSDKTCDYAFDALTCKRKPDGTWETTVELSNQDEIVMPLDIHLTFDDGSTATATIPVENWHKPGVDHHLPRWFWTDREYITTFETPKQVVRGVIDTSLTLLDLDRTNNTASTGLLSNLFPPSHTAFWRRWDVRRPLDKYSIRLRPTLWYSEADGPQIGFLADGGYAFDRYNTEAGLYFNTKSKRVDYKIGYETPVSFLGRLGRIALLGTNSDGVQIWRTGLSKEIRPYFYQVNSRHEVRLFAEHSRLIGENYPNLMARWDSGDYNRIGLGYSLFAGNRRKGGSVTFDFSSTFASRTEYAEWRLKGLGHSRIFGMKIQGDVFIGTSVGDLPAQNLFNGAGSSSRTMHDNLIHRLGMNAEPEFGERNHLLLPTEGFMIALTEAPDSIRFGKHIANARLELGLPELQSLVDVWPLRHIDVSLYASGGWVFPETVTFDQFSDYSVEAGGIVAVDLLDLFLSRTERDLLDTPDPVILALYMPIWASSPLLDETGVTWRWGISISQ